MTCPLCGRRPGRRACPALGQQICTVCCATKRLTEIRCPGDCRYLAAGREHPAAAVVRQREQDIAALVATTREYNERQTALFVLINRTILSVPADPLQPVLDVDVADASAALAATLETAVKGVIYEQRPASVPAGRIVAALRPVLERAGAAGGTAFERDAAVVFRDVARLARDTGARDGYLNFLRRTLGTAPAEAEAAGSAPEPTRLILP